MSYQVSLSLSLLNYLNFDLHDDILVVYLLLTVGNMIFVSRSRYLRHTQGRYEI